MIRYAPWNGWRVLFRISSQVQASSSSASATVDLQPAPCSESTPKIHATSDDSASKVISPTDHQTHVTSTSESKPTSNPLVKERNSSMVAAAFASLKLKKEGPRSSSLDESITEANSVAAFASLISERAPLKGSSSLDESITEADSVESLLSIAVAPVVSRRHALRIVSQLADWTSSGKVKLSDFEADIRFVKLCRLLGRGLPRESQGLEKDATGFGDLAVVLGVTGDDEAAKFVAGVSLSQMIRIMTSLSQKQRRSTPLLRALSFNIAKQTVKLNVKDCADLLYAMSRLNFPDELLLEKAREDLCECVPFTEKPAVIGSILMSLGFLRYKNTELLDILADWVLGHMGVCRSQDFVALLLTLANVNHTPRCADRLFCEILPLMTMRDARSHQTWLDIVWSLVVLEHITHQHVASVLDPDFCTKLAAYSDEEPRLSVASKLKLLNINAAAQLIIPRYKGPVLPPDSDVFDVPLTRSRDKQLLVASILDSFSNLLPSATYLRTNIDTGMGFLLDGECMLDSKCNPLPVTDEVTKSSNVDSEGKPVTSVKGKSVYAYKVPGSRSMADATQKGTRIGFLAWDYRDMCRGSQEPNGVAVLSMKLLERAGYKVLSIPHTEYNPREKLVRRVQYLDHQLKTLVKGS